MARGSTPAPSDGLPVSDADDGGRGLGKEDGVVARYMRRVWRGYGTRLRSTRAVFACVVLVAMTMVLSYFEILPHPVFKGDGDASRASVAAAGDDDGGKTQVVGSIPGGGDGDRARGAHQWKQDSSSSSSQRNPRVAADHVDVAKSKATMEDGTVVVGTSARVEGGRRVSQPKPCKPVDVEHPKAELNTPEVSAFVDMRTKMRVGKILRGCSKVSKEPEALYRTLHAAESFGPLCYFPEFLRGLASTLSVCSQNHEDGALLALMAFAGFKTREVVEICGGNGSENNGQGGRGVLAFTRIVDSRMFEPCHFCWRLKRRSTRTPSLGDASI